MNELFLDARFTGAKESSLTVKMISSGFLGLKKEILYFSPNLMFFEESEIIAQILYEGNTSLIVRPQKEMEMHYITDKYLKNPLLKMKIRTSFEKLMIGDDLYMNDFRYSFCMQVTKEIVRLSKVFKN